MEDLSLPDGGNTGDQDPSELFAALYQDLRKMAHARLKRSATPTLLNTTSLVNESYVRFVKSGRAGVEGRAHFLGYAARVMRSVVVDFAREQSASRRDAGFRITLDVEAVQPAHQGAVEILKVHAALDDLAKVSDRMARIVEMRYFAGMNEAEIAAALGLTERTVRRDWEKARIVLASSLR